MERCFHGYYILGNGERRMCIVMLDDVNVPTGAACCTIFTRHDDGLAFPVLTERDVPFGGPRPVPGTWIYGA